MAIKQKSQVYSVPNAEPIYGESTTDRRPAGPETLHQNVKGMRIWTTGLVIVGEMAGSGIVAMPEAMKFSSWAGIGLILMGAVLSGYTGVQLGWSWSILHKRWPEYREHTRKPYPAIAEKAVGVWMKHMISTLISVSLFGVCVVFILLSSTFLAGLIRDLSDFDISFCILLVIVAAVLLPVSFLKSPKDFWPAIVVAMVTTTIAVVLMLAGVIIDAPDKVGSANYPGMEFNKFFLAFSTILFAYGGHAAFPTIQHDMKQPSKFHISVLIAYIIIVLYYLPVSIAAYVVYGDSLSSDVMGSIDTNWIRQAVRILLGLHVFLGFIIVINPVNQEVEDLVKAPHKFCWQRVLVRTCIMGAILFCAESVPHFGAVLNLIAASTTTFLTFVFPGIFYLMLVHKYERAADQTRWWLPVPWYWMLLNVVIICIGMVGGIVATYASINALIHPPHGRTFTVPCYINATAAKG